MEGANQPFLDSNICILDSNNLNLTDLFSLIEETVGDGGNIGEEGNPAAVVSFQSSQEPVDLQQVTFPQQVNDSVSQVTETPQAGSTVTMLNNASLGLVSYQTPTITVPLTSVFNQDVPQPAKEPLQLQPTAVNERATFVLTTPLPVQPITSSTHNHSLSSEEAKNPTVTDPKDVSREAIVLQNAQPITEKSGEMGRSKAFNYVPPNIDALLDVNLNVDSDGSGQQQQQHFIDNPTNAGTGSQGYNFVGDHQIQEVHGENQIINSLHNTQQQQVQIGEQIFLLEPFETYTIIDNQMFESGLAENFTQNPEQIMSSNDPQSPSVPIGIGSIPCVDATGTNPNCATDSEVSEPKDTDSTLTPVTSSGTTRPNRGSRSRSQKKEVSEVCNQQKMYDLQELAADPKTAKKIKDAKRAKRCRENNKSKMISIMEERDTLMKEVEGRRQHEKILQERLWKDHGITFRPYSPST